MLLVVGMEIFGMLPETGMEIFGMLLVIGMGIFGMFLVTGMGIFGMVLMTGMEIFGMVLSHPEHTLHPCAPLPGKDTGKEGPPMVKKAVSSQRQWGRETVRDSAGYQ